MKKSRSRKRNIIWFNPPYNAAVSTNIGKQFLALITKHFPRHSRLSKIFNKNTIKLSYSCSPNMKTVISNHNKSLIQPTLDTGAEKCNCPDKADCPLNGHCLEEAIVYKSSVKTASTTKEYIGISEPPFKQRYGNHNMSFRTEAHKNNSKLSQYIWELKNKSAVFSIDWKIQARSTKYQCGSGICNLCLSEKHQILKGDPNLLLNKRSEIANKCRHKNKFKLSKVS